MLTVFTHVKYTFFPFFKFMVFELFIKWLIRIHDSSIVRLLLFKDALLCRKIGNLTYSCSNFKFCDKYRKFTITCFGDLGVNRNFSPGASEPIFFGGGGVLGFNCPRRKFDSLLIPSGQLSWTYDNRILYTSRVVFNILYLQRQAVQFSDWHCVHLRFLLVQKKIIRFHHVLEIFHP